jgi:hypothetical protein
MTDDPRDVTIRRPRRAHEDIASLEQRLFYAAQTILDLRAKLGTRLNQAAPPQVRSLRPTGVRWARSCGCR